jgi:hypothetical protein
MCWQTLVPAYDGSHTATIVMIGKCLRGPCIGLFLSRSFGTPAHLLHQFLCSIRKPFLRPDPRFAHVVARELSRLAVAPT